MISIVGLAGKDWVLLAADKSIGSSIICMNQSFDRLIQITPKHVLAMEGENGDTLQLSEYLQGNVALYKYRNSIELGSDALAHFIRSVIAGSLRTRNSYQVNMLLGGYDEKPSLYYLDYLGTLQPVPYGAQGYCAYFVLSVFDKHYKADMTLEDGKKLMKMALDQIANRFTIMPHGFLVKQIDSEGIKVIEL